LTVRVLESQRRMNTHFGEPASTSTREPEPLLRWRELTYRRTLIMIQMEQHACHRTLPLRQRSLHMVLLFATGVVAACSSSASTPDGGSCTQGGTPGPADDHCSTPDGGTMIQAVDPAACMSAADAGDAGGPASQSCLYGRTMYREEGDDDDCKYHVVWSSTPICKGSTVAFTMVATVLASGMPLTGAATRIEAFTTTPGDWDSAVYCDARSNHYAASIVLTENPPGTYAGSLVLDQSGPWTVRFHFFETCVDTPDSQHGHAAFHVSVP
jgi:hypothetical protein